jgi:glycosyltransferase involved in cell wall biosynthesis
MALPPQASDSAEFKMHLGHLSDRVDLTELADLNLQTLAAHSKRICATRTVVTDGDLFARHLARTREWHGTGRLSLLIMREFAQPDKNRLMMWIKNAAKRLIYARASSSSGVDLAVLKSALWTGTSKFRVAIDPVQLSSSAADVARIRNEWELDRSVYWFAVLGAITDRKNVPLIAQSLMLLETSQVGLLVAGSFDPSVRALIQDSASLLSKAGKSVRLVDELLSDPDLDAAVSTADCLVLAHSNEGPSGLMGKAAAAGTRVVAAGATSLRNDVASFGEAGLWCPLDIETMAGTLQTAMELPASTTLRSSTTTSFLKTLLPYE